jgi:hypothetical protein
MHIAVLALPGNKEVDVGALAVPFDLGTMIAEAKKTTMAVPIKR